MERHLKVSEAGIGIYKEVRENDENMNEILEIIHSLEEQFKIIDMHKENIYNVYMIPQLKLIEESVNNALESASGKSHVELDKSKWAIQSSLNQSWICDFKRYRRLH